MKYAGQHHYDKPELDPNYHGSGVLWTEVYNNTPKEFIKEEYIKTCYSQEELNESEDFNIEKYNTLYPNGYNLKKGGCYSELTIQKISEKLKGRKSWNKGMKMSDEFKRKNSESHKGLQSGEKNPMYGKHHTEEIKRKLSEARKEIPSPNKGKHLSEETKRKISEARKGKKCSEETVKKLSKQVLQYTLDGILICEWSSIHECERNGFNRAGIRQCCVGKFKQYRGFIWCYK